MHTELKRLAAENDRTLFQEVRRALRLYIEAQNGKPA